jgi:hypothetical protein
MILLVDRETHLEFGRSYIYRVLFGLENDNFVGWYNEIIIYKR